VRSPSISSDIQSVSTLSVAASIVAPPSVNPQPAYVASNGASQLLSSEVGSTVSVSESALVLLNNFLDQILFSILSAAHSVNLGHLKAAVPLVLKPRLGKAALKAADEELKEYLEESDDVEWQTTSGSFESRSGFDLELAWKLARLRCMVYTRLGDLEEEDEEEYIEQEQLHDQESSSRRSIYLRPESAIFLTSVLEYLGEQALYYAAQHAQKRFQAGKTQGNSQEHEANLANESELWKLEEVDMFQVGRESPLSRLWRSWRRNIRFPREPASRPMSPDPTESPALIRSRKNSIGVPVSTASEGNQSLGKVLESNSPSQMPLPMSDRDVDEIEVPGLAPEIVDDENERPSIQELESSRPRPTSMLIAPGDVSLPSSPMPPDGSSQLLETITQRPKARTRSSSLPMPAPTIFTTAQDTQVFEVVPTEETRDGEADKPSSGDVELEKEAHPIIEQCNAEEPEPGDNSIEDTTGSMPSNSAADTEHERLGRVAAAVSAVAGALGISAGIAAQELKEQKEEKPARTVAEEFLGPSSDVPPPKDAVMSASITSVGDFDSIHVPVERAPPGKESISDMEGEGSDPEDLALSSTDEEPSRPSKEGPADLRDHIETEKKQLTSHQQSTSTEMSFHHDADNMEKTSQNEALVAPIVTNVAHSDQASIEASQEGTVIQQSSSPQGANIAQPSEGSPTRTTNLHAEKEGATSFRSSYQSVINPGGVSRSSRGLTGSQIMQSPTSTINEQDVSVDSHSRPGTAGSATVPARFSSASGKATGHVQANSKTSQYSPHSKSSSSSSKLLGFDREQHSWSQQSNRGDVAAIPVNSVRGVRRGSVGNVKEQFPTPGSPRSNRRHLRLRTESEEGRRAASPVDSVDESKTRDLDVLINSDETLHYTLTPLSARAEKVSQRLVFLLLRLTSYLVFCASTAINSNSGTSGLYQKHGTS
jgi:hypothetical protein